jgi:hypothetical protein
MTASANFGLDHKWPKKKQKNKEVETSPGNSGTAEVLLGGDKRSLPSGNKKDLQF